MVPLTQTFRKCAGGYRHTKAKENINHLIYKDDIKMFDKNEKELETLTQAVRIFS